VSNATNLSDKSTFRQESLGDASVQTSLQLEYQRLNGYWFSFNGQGNQVYATVTANGGLFRSSRIEIQGKAKLLRIH